MSTLHCVQYTNRKSSLKTVAKTDEDVSQLSQCYDIMTR